MSEPEKSNHPDNHQEHEIEVIDDPSAEQSGPEAEALEAIINDAELDSLLPPDQAPESPETQDLLAEINKWKDLAIRSQADLDNFRKRMVRERSDAIQYANSSLLASLLPVIDSFEMGLKAAKHEGENSMIYKGMTMVHKQMADFLVENKVEIVEAEEGATFDPNLHEAIQESFSDSVPEGKVLYTLRNGYRLKDRLLRPANVVLSKGPGEA